MPSVKNEQYFLIGTYKDPILVGRLAESKFYFLPLEAYTIVLKDVFELAFRMKFGQKISFNELKPIGRLEFHTKAQQGSNYTISLVVAPPTVAGVVEEKSASKKSFFSPLESSKIVGTILVGSIAFSAFLILGRLGKG